MREQPPRTGSRFSEALIRLREDPRMIGRWAGLSVGLFVFLGTVAAFAFVLDGIERPFYLLVFLAFLGSVLVGAFSGVTVQTTLYRTLGSHPLPEGASRADVRAAGKVIGSGAPSGDAEVDRIARTLVARSMEGRYQGPALNGLFCGGMVAMLFLQWLFRYASEGWTLLTVSVFAAASFFLVVLIVALPLMVRGHKRARAFAAAYDAARGEPSEGGPDGP
ncbi:hypothetical protein [Nocardiopsis oceani]